MAMELEIIADDLTGAVDTAVQFAKQGIAAAAALSADARYGSIESAVQVIAVTTESRHIEPGAAFERVVLAVKKAKKHGIARFYKKIDSTFRGNVGSELEALLQAAGAGRLFLVPAFPAGGRTTVGARQYVDGVPLEKTPFCRDPRSAVTESFIPAILGRTTSLPVVCVDRKALPSFNAKGAASTGIFVFDAESDGDLAAAATAIGRSGKRPLCGGAAGFAALLPGMYGMKGGALLRRRLPDRILVVNGSLNDASLGQVAAAREAGVPCCELPAAGQGDAGALAAGIVQQMNRSGCAVLTVPPRQAVGPAGAFAEAAGRAAAAVLSAMPSACAAVFGGDTAAAVCRCIGCEILFPYDEIIAGLTVCSTSAGSGGRTLILKSGGFGPRHVVQKIRQYLRQS